MACWVARAVCCTCTPFRWLHPHQPVRDDEDAEHSEDQDVPEHKENLHTRISAKTAVIQMAAENAGLRSSEFFAQLTMRRVLLSKLSGDE